MTTAILALLLLALAVGIVIGGIAATLIEISKRQAPGEPRRAGDIGPADLPYWGGDRK